MRRTFSAACSFWLWLAFAAVAQTAADPPHRGGTTGTGIESFFRNFPDLPAQGFSLMPPGPRSATPAPAVQPPPTAFTEYHPVVVELYTSQGCSSCPPADGLLAEIAGRDDVIALALHVDYWDYIGWADRFAKPGFTKRQKAYARAAGEHAIYTPQMIVGGAEHLVGLRPMELVGLIDRYNTTPSQVRLSLAREGEVLRVRLEAQPPLPRAAVVQLVRYRPEETVRIEHGENAGRVIRYSNIVTDWAPIAEWDGRQPLNLDASAPGSDAAVVIVQEQGPGAILAAARLR
ncbi:DUF1223 domain-containing protein [Frigidibacter mobilis]|uniref:DUF1223 domain-containing protein n=1 Tax=Frigidibacter mobilis TaxID=1335048 RepID=A0A159Z3Y5_9RHOB|nr:DUF1223 domain-containing protein [Frigidibacter mobilis]AMY68934.1 hypothetical protein AKL17_1682 [Frigidibacter mobilis]